LPFVAGADGWKELLDEPWKLGMPLGGLGA
jgi:hypothetical protein